MLFMAINVGDTVYDPKGKPHKVTSISGGDIHTATRNAHKTEKYFSKRKPVAAAKKAAPKAKPAAKAVPKKKAPAKAAAKKKPKIAKTTRNPDHYKKVGGRGKNRNVMIHKSRTAIGPNGGTHRADG